MFRGVRKYATLTPGLGVLSILGTAPSHRSYLFIRSPVPPSEFRSKMRTPLSMALLSKLLPSGGLVNWFWLGKHGDSSDKIINFDDMSNINPVVYSATAFSVAGGRIEIPELSVATLDRVSAQLEDLNRGPSKVLSDSEDIDIYVCTHGARECACGAIGGEVVKALREEVSRRKRADPDGPILRVRVGEIGHVGGH